MYRCTCTYAYLHIHTFFVYIYTTHRQTQRERERQREGERERDTERERERDTERERVRQKERKRQRERDRDRACLGMHICMHTSRSHCPNFFLLDVGCTPRDKVVVPLVVVQRPGQLNCGSERFSELLQNSLARSSAEQRFT